MAMSRLLSFSPRRNSDVNSTYGRTAMRIEHERPRFLLAPCRGTSRRARLGQAAKGQALPLRGNSPPDRDRSDRQIKTAKQPRREVATATHALQNEPNLLNGVRFRG